MVLQPNTIAFSVKLHMHSLRGEVRCQLMQCATELRQVWHLCGVWTNHLPPFP